MKVNAKSKPEEAFESIELTFIIESKEELSAIYSLFDHSDLVDGFIDPYLGEGFADKVRNQLDDATEDGVIEGEIFDKLVEVIGKVNHRMVHVMKTISVKLHGVFIKDYYNIKQGTKVIIDKLRHDNCQSGIMCHISNDVKVIGDAKWFDSNWFKFDK